MGHQLHPYGLGPHQTPVGPGHLLASSPTPSSTRCVFVTGDKIEIMTFHHIRTCFVSVEIDIDATVSGHRISHKVSKHIL